MLDPRRLLILDAVARAGSMTAAAAALAYTPSAVSQAMSALEREAGAALVLRGPRGVRLTEAGAVLARHAAALRERMELAAEELHDVTSLRAGRLRLAAFPSAGSVLVPPAVAAFRAEHPAVELSLDEAESDEAADGLRDGRFDLAIVFEYDFEAAMDPAGIELHPLGTDQMLVALPPDHPLAGRDTVAMDGLAGETWVSSADPTCNRALTHGAGRAGFTPKVAFASDDYGAVGRLVMAGVGVALVPELAAAAVGDAVVLRRLDPAPSRRISVAVPLVRSAAADAMLAVLTSARGRSTSSAPAGASAGTPRSSPPRAPRRPASRGARR
jgi:DNA-binding transcriptional LysR family regulator